MDALTRFIQETGGEEWRFGFSDCAPWVARWVELASGLKVPVPEYHDMKGSVQVVRTDGGLLPLFCRLARETGLEETMFPQRGDIGLHHHPQAMSLQILAVCLGGGKWAAKVSKTAQVATFDGAPIKCWKVPRKS